MRPAHRLRVHLISLSHREAFPVVAGGGTLLIKAAGPKDAQTLGIFFVFFSSDSLPVSLGSSFPVESGELCFHRGWPWPSRLSAARNCTLVSAQMAGYSGLPEAVTSGWFANDLSLLCRQPVRQPQKPSKHTAALPVMW